MSLTNLTKMLQNDDSPLGDLCRDILRDKKYPSNNPEGDQWKYLENMTILNPGAEDAISQLKTKYEHLDQEAWGLESLVPARSERWGYWKENFVVDYVFLVGESSDIYKAYCVDVEGGALLFFDLKFCKSLNDLKLRNISQIPDGALTQEFEIKESIKALKECTYDNNPKPNPEIFDGLLELLESRL